MPTEVAKELFGRLLENPELARDVNWGLVIENSPDIDIDMVRQKFGEYLPEAPADADVNFLLSHPLHKPRELTLTRWVGDQLNSGWNWYLNKLTEFEEINIPARSNRRGELGRTTINLALGAGRAFAGLPAFAGEAIHAGRPLVTKGDAGESYRRGRSLLEGFVDPAAKAAALLTSRIESADRPPTKIEKQWYEDVTGKEAFGVVLPPLIAITGPRMVRRGYKYVRGAGEQILSRNFQKIAPLEGVKGEFVRVGDKPATRKLYHKDPVEGWREFRSKKKPKTELADALDQYVDSVTPKQLPSPAAPPLLPVPEARGLLPAPETVYGDGFTARAPKPGETPANTYLRMPMERVRKDAGLGVKAAKEALKIRQFEEPKTPSRLLEGETPLARPAGRRVGFEEPITLKGDFAPFPSRKIYINPEVDKMLGKESARRASEFIAGILGREEAGKLYLPSRGELKRGARVVGKVASLGEALARPSVKLRRSKAGQKMIQHVIEAETVERTIRANAEVIMDTALKKKYESGKLTRGDRAWMKENFKAFYEDGRSMPNERIQGFANAWTTTADRIGRIAEKVGVRVRGKGFKRRANYFPYILTEKGRLALEAQRGDIWNALIAELEKRGKTTEGIEKLLGELSPRAEAEAVKRVGSLEQPRLLELPDEVTVNGRVVKILETDPLEVIPQYITRSSRRIGVIKSFGQGNELARSLIKEAGENIEARKVIENAWHDVQRFAHQPSVDISTAMRVIRPVENITRGALLSLAQLSNVPGEIATVYKAGLKNSTKAFVDSFRKSQTAKFDFDRKLGAWSNDVLRDLQTTEDLTGRTGKLARGAMRAYGFEGINRHINKVGARAMQLTIEDYFDLLRKGESSTLQKMMGRSQEAVMRTLQRDFFWTEQDITRIKTSGLTIKDKARVAQRAPALINVIGESALDRPSWIRHPVMQRFMAYTSFGRAMGNILADAVKETRQGNFKPLATFLAGQQLAGELEIWLKNFVLNKERTDTGWTDRLINNFLGSMTFGVWGLGYEKLKWARGNPIEGMMPPNIEVPIELATEMTKAVANGELPDAFRAVAERIPIWRVGAVQAEKLIDPESAEARKKERTQRQMSRHYNEQYFQALKDGDEKRMELILDEAEERGVDLSKQSVTAKMGEEIKRGARKLDVFETLGAGRKKR